MTWLKNFISDLTNRISSRKFIVLVTAVTLHLNNPLGFTGDNLVWVFSIFIGFDVLQKFVEAKKI